MQVRSAGGCRTVEFVCQRVKETVGSGGVGVAAGVGSGAGEAVDGNAKVVDRSFFC